MPASIASSLIGRRPVSASADPFAPYRRVGLALAVLILLMILAEFAWNWAHPTSRDFISFWGASQLALAGRPELAYDTAAIHSVQLKVATFGAGEMPFPYAPA